MAQTEATINALADRRVRETAEIIAATATFEASRRAAAISVTAAVMATSSQEAKATAAAARADPKGDRYRHSTR